MNNNTNKQTDRYIGICQLCGEQLDENPTVDICMSCGNVTPKDCDDCHIDLFDDCTDEQYI